MNDLMIAVRALHFAATILVAGAIFFSFVIAEPVFRSEGIGPAASAFRNYVARIAWIGLGIAVVSCAGWLVLVAADIARRRADEIFADDIVWKVVVGTQFGRIWSARMILALSLACSLLVLGRGRAIAGWRGAVPVSLAIVLLASLAWTGHAAGTPRLIGDAHVVADALHVLGAGVWVGALLPLAWLLAAARKPECAAWKAVAPRATRRFSTLGVTSVATILVTGLINAYLLAGSVPALTETEYGRLLLLKIALFLAMVSIAAVNRLRLTPQLASASAGADAARRLGRNSLVELALGLTILVIVGALGTLPPGLHAAMPAHMHAH